jgi:lipoprotein NlpI
LYFFLGQQQLVNGQSKQALESFQKSINTGVSEFTEYALSQRELATITAAKQALAARHRVDLLGTASERMLQAVGARGTDSTTWV